jgi:hypothetical protein
MAHRQGPDLGHGGSGVVEQDVGTTASHADVKDAPAGVKDESTVAGLRRELSVATEHAQGSIGPLFKPQEMVGLTQAHGSRLLCAWQRCTNRLMQWRIFRAPAW